MNRKRFLLALSFLVAITLAMIWLISMAQFMQEQSSAAPVIDAQHPAQPAPVPLAPTGATVPAGRTGIAQTARLQPEPRPVPPPDTIARAGMQPDSSHTWHPAPLASLGALALLAATVLLWLTAARISSASMNVRGA